MGQTLTMSDCENVKSTDEMSVEIGQRKRAEKVKSADEMSSPNLIKLNVGGETFHTTRRSLEKSGFFLSLLNSGVAPELDENKQIFVDRDPQLFRYILCALRTDTIYLGKDISEEAIRDEVRYFKLKMDNIRWIGGEKKEDEKSVPNLIKLNVGGEIFHTMRTTLEKSGFFLNLLNSGAARGVDENKLIFIDRAPQLFRHVLCALRTNTIYLGKDISEEALRNEVKYFELNKENIRWVKKKRRQLFVREGRHLFYRNDNRIYEKKDKIKYYSDDGWWFVKELKANNSEYNIWVFEKDQ